MRWLRRHEREGIKAKAPAGDTECARSKRELLHDGLDFMCATGLRKGVVFNLRKADVDRDDFTAFEAAMLGVRPGPGRPIEGA